MVMSRSVIVFLLTLAVPLNNAIAEKFYGEDGSVCTDEDYRQSVANIAKARKLEQGGSYRQAYETLGHTGCSWATHNEEAFRENLKEESAIRKRLCKGLGDEAEKKGQLQEAFDWYRKGEGSYIKDQERVMMKMAKAKQDDLGTIETAFNYFKGHHMADSLKTIRAMAMQNAKPWLAEEDKQFGSKQSEIYRKAFGSLEQAQKWLAFAEAPENRMAAERAEKRGDSMASQTTPYYLKETIKYYNFAGTPEKIKSVQGRAKKLGDEAKGKGESELAVDYYQIAGLSNEARDLQKRTEAQQRKDEGKRQQQFKKDQGNLEKELGM
jgi:hypothetical protein